MQSRVAVGEALSMGASRGKAGAVAPAVDFTNGWLNQTE
jgi:hypothetical protein